MMNSQFFICCSACKLLREENNLGKKLLLLVLKILFLTKGICVQVNKHLGFCEKYRNFAPENWFSCPGLYSNQIFGEYDMICNPFRYGSKTDQISSKNEFIPDGHCVIRYKNLDYEVHCCCYWRFRHKCTIPLDSTMHVCANVTQDAINGKEQIFDTTLQTLPMGSSCFASFRLNVADDETVQLIGTSYGVPTKTDKNTYRCHQYISTSRSTRCSATESCLKMCPLLTPFSFNTSQTLTVVCCCDNRKDSMCNIKTDFGQNVLLDKNNYELTKCAHRHILQHIFSSDIYSDNCIVFYDFSLMMPLNLIYGYNMEFERSAEEIYSSKEELIVADIFEYNLENTWTKCCTEVNATKSQIDRITKSVKAWTVAVLKCNGKKEPRCDADLVEKINQKKSYYFNYYENKYGRLCYLKDFIEKENTRGRSLETTWCYEETHGRGLGEISTICCCSSIVDKPCNYIGEKYHVEKTKVYYSKKILQTRGHCMLPDGRRDLCLLTSEEKVICYYLADMKNRKVEGGCAVSLMRKPERHKLANICLLKELYNLAEPVEYLYAAEAIKIFCCSGRDDCKGSVLEMKRFKKFFETEHSKMIKTLKEEDFAFISS
ncbi:unnamed protein product [Onchocerca flexuosa]|uniref:Ig-like domain-containing protein n=1 Tax=Onchocerca flexuosa TaxID=387005 RepID=A0A183HZ82_9BILA|nr:unnamed protein product [Onchocerca flexuosa]